jgi:hypothetical protein
MAVSPIWHLGLRALDAVRSDAVEDVLELGRRGLSVAAGV